MMRLMLDMEIPPVIKRTLRLMPIVIGVLVLTAAWGCASVPTPQPSAGSSDGLSTPQAMSKESEPQAVVQIKGMACPFCTYNIQRQIQALQGVQHVEVSLEKGEAYVTLSKQNPPTEDQLRAAVESAGFTPGEVRMP